MNDMIIIKGVFIQHNENDIMCQLKITLRFVIFKIKNSNNEAKVVDPVNVKSVCSDHVLIYPSILRF